MAEESKETDHTYTTEELLAIFLQPVGAPGRSVAYYSVGLTDELVIEALNVDRFAELQIARGSVDRNVFALVDLVEVEGDDVPHYRVLCLLAGLREQLTFDAHPQKTLANAVSGGGFSLRGRWAKISEDPLFKMSTTALLKKSGQKDKIVSAPYLAMFRNITDFYDLEPVLVGLLARNEQDGRWFVWEERLFDSTITLRLIIRHVPDAEPEIIVMVDYNEEEKEQEALESQFNCDFNDILLEEKKGDVETIQPRTVLLRLVDQSDTSEREFTFPCAPEAETLVMVVNAFALCFPQYTTVHTLCNEQDEVIDSDEHVRATYVFVRIIDDDQEQANIPEMRIDPPVFPRAQFQVAKALYDRVRAQLESDGRRMEDYSGLCCVVLVPKFNSLKQQTEERAQGCVGLSRPDANFRVSVELYPNSTSLGRMDLLMQEVRSGNRPGTLYVLIVDECHYAPSSNAIPLLHDATVREAKNVVVVMVSATPYNCVSTQSRIPPGNILEWGEQVDPNDTPSYIGFEHYFRSIAFCLPRPGGSASSYSTTDPDLQIEVGYPATVRDVFLDHHGEYADNAALAAMISQRLQFHGVPLTCACDIRDKVVFRRRQNLSIPLFIRASPLMASLGFAGGVRFNAGVQAVTAPDFSSIGDEVRLTRQHLREDSHFVALYKSIVDKCDMLRRFNVKSTVKLPAEWGGLHGQSPPEKRLQKKMMSAKNGFTIILDYILSIAYYGSCRIARNHEDATFRLQALPENGGGVVTDQVLETFLSMVAQCCYFDDDRSGQAFNLGDALNAALKSLYSSAREESALLVGDADCLRYILSEKLLAERNQATTSASQSWYTETDRVVRMLLTERSPAPMVLMRVYDKDENMAMQIVLRHALEVCGLVIQCPSGRSVPAFSVISDTSETSLLTQIEDHFRYDYNVGEEGGAVLHVQDIVALRERTAAEAIAAAERPKKGNADLKYEDLLNIPCLIILCEKGRMGDTFPHTLRTLDLRLRTGGTASCFLQEIGRMCRYPRTRDATIVHNVAEAEAYCAQSRHGVLVSAVDTQRFLGVAHVAAEVERIVLAAYPVAQFPVVLAQLVHPLPYALIDPDVMESICDAVNKREVQIACAVADQAAISHSLMSERRRANKIIRRLKMARGVDAYLSSKLMRDPLEYKLQPKGGHYDTTNMHQSPQQQDGLHHRRFLLSAECQVGKTGAYLHFLSLVRSAITGLDGDGQLVPVAPLIPVGLPWHRWLIPQLRDLTQQPDMLYEFPKMGKYHRCIALQRLAQIQSLMATQVNGYVGDESFTERYVDAIQTYECTVSERGRQKLAELPVYMVPPVDNPDNDWLLNFINWDGRFIREGAWHACRAELIDTFNQWNEMHGAVEVPLAQNVMFGQHPSVTVLDAEQDGLNSQPDALAPHTELTWAFRTVTVAQDLNARCRAKTVAEYQLSARLVPTNDSMLIDLDDFFIMQHAQHAGYHESVDPVRLSIPAAALNIPAKDLPACSTALTQKLGTLLRTPGKIGHWVFTPTFSGTNAGPQDKLLMRDDAYTLPSGPLNRWKDYGEVLLVRACQLRDYQRFYGGTHIIAAMPETMQYIDEHGKPGPMLSAAEHGCGYSRRFGQLLASYLGLERVWMIDDYVLKCWQIVCEDPCSTRNNVEVRSASFAEVMMHIESLFNQKPRSPYPQFATRAAEALRDLNKDALSEIIGPAESYGVVGMWRGYQWRDDVTHPVKKSYSVYSFFLLNVEATVGRGLYFPARPIWEDIEFNNLLDEQKLLVCKLQVFAHEKKLHSPAIELPALPVDEPTLYSSLRDAGYLLSGEAHYSERMMTLPEANPVLNDFEESLPPQAPLEQQVTFLSAAHNASAYQSGALAGLLHECSLQACVHKIVNESMVLGHVLELAAITKQSVQWLLLLPMVGTISHADAVLATLGLPDGCSLTFQLQPDTLTPEPVFVILATLSDSATVLPVATAQPNTQPMELESDCERSQQPNQSSVAPTPKASPRAGRATAKSRTKIVDRVDEWVTNNAQRLIGQFKALGNGKPLHGAKKEAALKEVFQAALTAVNELGGTRFDNTEQLHKICLKKWQALQAQIKRQRSKEVPLETGQTREGSSAIQHSADDGAGFAQGDALEGEGSVGGGGAFPEENGSEGMDEGEEDEGEDEGEDREDNSSPTKRRRMG